MKTEFTIKERHEIYIRAKEFYLSGLLGNNIIFGLCYVICEAIYYKYEFVCGYKYIENMFSEFAKHKPKSARNKVYWWGKNNTKKRIEVLDNCIEQTK